MQAWGLLELQRGNVLAAVLLLERCVASDPRCSPVLKWKAVRVHTHPPFLTPPDIARLRLHQRLAPLLREDSGPAQASRQDQWAVRSRWS